MTAFNQFAPGSAKVTDGNGNATSAFQIWMRNVWLRGGGADALSSTELEALIALAQAAADAAQADLDAHEVAADPHPSYLTQAEGDAAYQPLDSDLTAIAALTTTAFGRGLLALADAAALAAAHAHTLAQVTDVTMTVANLNALDDGANTTLHFHDADRDRAVHTGTQAAATISDFDTQVRTSRLDQMAAPAASVSFNDQQATSFRVENRTSDPGTPTTGQIWLRTDL